MKIPIHHICHSMANGPGYRLVIWVQGCKFKCKNCFNPDTHDFNKGILYDIDSLVRMSHDVKSIDGITLSGGEPLEYVDQLLYLLGKIDSQITTILYSGYNLNEILQDEKKKELIKKVDLSILGRYNDCLSHPYEGKTFVRSTNRIDMDYFTNPNRIEYAINSSTITKTGIFKTVQI